MNGLAALRQPSAGPGRAEAGRRFYDNGLSAWMVKVFPGEYYVTSDPQEVLVTVLGSCVSACIRDPATGIGGMNHFMLPQSQSGSWGGTAQSTRFGNFAMEKLINELLKAGCLRTGLEIKLFGGGNVIDTTSSIGTHNAEFALHYLEAEGLRVAVADLGGQLPRRINYFPATGKVIRRLLGSNESTAIVREENEYVNSISTHSPAGEIELFT